MESYFDDARSYLLASLGEKHHRSVIRMADHVGLPTDILRVIADYYIDDYIYWCIYVYGGNFSTYMAPYRYIPTPRSAFTYAFSKLFNTEYIDPDGYVFTVSRIVGTTQKLYVEKLETPRIVRVLQEWSIYDMINYITTGDSEYLLTPAILQWFKEKIGGPNLVSKIDQVFQKLLRPQINHIYWNEYIAAAIMTVSYFDRQNILSTALILHT